jgi:hypothetical protein
MIATSASLRSDFIHIVGMAIHIAPESANHIAGIRTRANDAPLEDRKWWAIRNRTYDFHRVKTQLLSSTTI